MFQLNFLISNLHQLHQAHLQVRLVLSWLLALQSWVLEHHFLWLRQPQRNGIETAAAALVLLVLHRIRHRIFLSWGACLKDYFHPSLLLFGSGGLHLTPTGSEYQPAARTSSF